MTTIRSTEAMCNIISPVVCALEGMHSNDIPLSLVVSLCKDCETQTGHDYRDVLEMFMKHVNK